MPLDPNVAISAGGQFVGGIINSVAQGQQNKKARKFAREMYARQRADNLSDWERENLYNSPRAQMQRLQEAGLNPNLVYGNGATASGGHINEANYSTPDIKPTRPGDAIANAGSAYMGGMYMAELRKAQIDNVRSSTTRNLNDALMTAARLIGQSTDNAVKKIGLTNLEGIQKKAAQEYGEGVTPGEMDWYAKNRKSMAEYGIAEAAEQRAAQQYRQAEGKYPLDMKIKGQILKNLVADMHVKEAQKREINKRIDIMVKDGTLKQLEINMKKNGIQAGDPAWLRILMQASGLGKENDSALEK